MQISNNTFISCSSQIEIEAPEKKRKRQENFQHEEILGPGPDNKKTKSEDDDQVEGETSSNDSWATTTKVESLVEFKTFLGAIKTLNFKERIHALREHMSPKETHHDIYVELTCPDQLDNLEAASQEAILSIKFTLEETRFKSSSFREANMKEGTARNQKFFSLRAFEYVEDEKTEEGEDVRIMKLYSSQNGLKGELAWVQNGDRLKGSTLIKLYDLMREILPIKTTYLYDDANKYLHLVKETDAKISLRKLKVLSNPADNFLSWYEEKWGFSPAVLKNFRAKKDTFTQDPKAYRRSISHVRETPLATVQTIRQNDANQIELLKQRYPGRRAITSRTPLTMRRKVAPTLHTLVKSMAEAERIVEAKQQAQDDLFFVFQNVIENYSLKQADEKGKALLSSLTEIEGMRIFVRKGD